MAVKLGVVQVASCDGHGWFHRMAGRKMNKHDERMFDKCEDV